ncbi:MAG: DUF5667 domain-containing protein [Candidatus Promineifilaceae bacterium]
MNRKIDIILDECLASLQAGDSLESCLNRYPEHAEELKPLLEMAQTVQSIPIPQARPEAVQAGRQQMLSVVTAKGGSQPVSKSLFARYAEQIIVRITGKENPDMILMTRFAAAMLIAILAFGGWGVTSASADAIPGDLLYPVKTTMENARLLLTTDPSAREELQQEIQERRRLEIQEAIQAGRETDVRFQGELLAFDENSWVVGGLRVMVDNNTVITGQPVIGALVNVNASITPDGNLLAQMLTVEGLTPPYPGPGATSLPMPTHEPTHMPTHEPTHMPTHEPTNMPPMPTHEPTHMPTHEPTNMPTPEPTNMPPMPTHEPTHMPTHEPTHMPTHEPTNIPPMPIHEPTHMPTHEPTHEANQMPKSSH